MTYESVATRFAVGNAIKRAELGYPVDPFDGQAEVCSARGSVDIQPGLSAGRLVDRIEDASRANPVGAGEPW